MAPSRKLLLASRPSRAKQRDPRAKVFQGTRTKVAGFLVSAIIGGLFALPDGASAASYSAKELLRSSNHLYIQQGSTATFTIGLKNTGSRTWHRDGSNFISIYTHGPKYRKSAFRDSSWMSDVQPVRMRDASAAPGTLGWFTFRLQAPDSPGEYHETFHVAAEDLAWIPGGSFTIGITVTAKASPAIVPATRTVTATPTSVPSRSLDGYEALKLLVSDREMELETGEEKTFRVGFKNTGDTSWTRMGSDAVTLWALPGNSYSFRHNSWQNEVAAKLPVDEIKPGQLAFFTVKLSAPRNTGRFIPRFSLASGNNIIEGGIVEIPIDVRRGAVQPTVSTEVESEFSLSGDRGPDIRIGLFNVEPLSAPIRITANGAYRLMDSNDNPVTSLSGVTTVTFDLASRTYDVVNGSFSRTMQTFLYFEPIDGTTIFEIPTYERRAAWDASYNFNRFRGKIEIFYTANTGRLWVVEELPVEDYIRGLAETSNGSHFEYQKALVTAARTYALFVKSIGGKHKNEFFDLNTGAYDQVYKGYVSELIRPNVVRAVEETRGTVVTYDGEIVVTPYFSRSDGRTRSWTEVWSSTPHPWLVSVPAPYDAGRTLWGHGVGMSALDALGRAEAGVGWTDILKHYYTGIQLKKIY